MHKANRFVLRYARWHISEKRPRRGLWRELYLQRRWDPSLPRRSSASRKEEKTRLSPPPRLVGANEGGTDRPVCALPLSGSCRASTPKCTLHRSQRRLSFSLRASSCLFSSTLSTWCYEILSSEKQAPFVCRMEKKRGTDRYRYRCTSQRFFFSPPFHF